MKGVYMCPLNRGEFLKAFGAGGLSVGIAGCEGSSQKPSMLSLTLTLIYEGGRLHVL